MFFHEIFIIRAVVNRPQCCMRRQFDFTRTGLWRSWHTSLRWVQTIRNGFKDENGRGPNAVYMWKRQHYMGCVASEYRMSGRDVLVTFTILKGVPEWNYKDMREQLNDRWVKANRCETGGGEGGLRWRPINFKAGTRKLMKKIKWVGSQCAPYKKLPR